MHLKIGQEYYDTCLISNKYYVTIIHLDEVNVVFKASWQNPKHKYTMDRPTFKSRYYLQKVNFGNELSNL